MPRRDFNADLKSATESQIQGITAITRGEGDEEIDVCFVPPNGPPIELTLLAQPDVSSYPRETSFMIFTKSEALPPGVLSVLEDISGFSYGTRILELVTTISEKLHGLLATGARDAPILLGDSDVEMQDVFSDVEGGEEDDGWQEEYGGFSDEDEVGSPKTSTAAYRIDPKNVEKLNRRIRHDLRAAKFAGFSIGILNGMKAESVSSLVSLSVRVANLGLSEEAIQAWDLEPKNYIILLIRYSSGYRTYETIIDEPAKSANMEFRIGTYDKYKPTVTDAIAAFTDITKNSKKTPIQVHNGFADENSGHKSAFTNLFISSSLNNFFNAQFVSLLKIRSSMGLSWDGAKKYFGDKQGKIFSDSSTLEGEYYGKTDSAVESDFPGIVTDDHLKDDKIKEYSVPLLAAQFAMKYLTRCTEFCLVCHDKIDEKFGALKPYVCDKPLCLYQYMSLGFGPSVEHEILTQPYVVDLLVSFCYAAAYARKLREYPTGMSLSVPPVATYIAQDYSSGHRPPVVAKVSASTGKTPPTSIEVAYDAARHEVLFLADSEKKPCPVKHGDWIILTTDSQREIHYRVEDTSCFPRIVLSNILVTRRSIDSAMAIIPVPYPPAYPPAPTPATTPPPSSSTPAKMIFYNSNFDELEDGEKAETIVMLLDTLPSIIDLRSYLIQQSRYGEPKLAAWKERVSPAAVGLLRWIIASNRSCIVQVDKCAGQSNADAIAAKVRLNQRVSNISEDWVQFRFAQGSPDKEQRFLKALQEEQTNFDVRYPTIFAWHGSPLANWHSIIRTGLDFKETLHGRAFGNGVYHSQDQATSIAYAQMGSPPSASLWHASALKITAAMSLNEVVNCVSKYQSSHPHLVVQFPDWIQCRYLLIKVDGAVGNGCSHKSIPDEEVEQDPKHTVKGYSSKPIGVPLCAVAISRAFCINAKAEATSESRNHKKKRKSVSAKVNVFVAQDLAASEDEEISDLAFLFSDSEEAGAKDKKENKKVNLPPMTDFEPGTLDQSKLPMLDPPSYATPGTTKGLNRALKEILEVQKKTPLHELGWYIDPELVQNVYQWIVELHSFDATIPLAKDMKVAGVNSVVLEIRFPQDFPFSPPFIRVVRPRFLPFGAGGGGHVTAGGAICMELLTNNGWSSVSTMESVLLQVRMAISSLETPARLESGGLGRGTHDYGTAEAIDAYVRACRAHSWTVPKGFVEGFSQTGGRST